jgi:hypothetical protein
MTYPSRQLLPLPWPWPVMACPSIKTLTVSKLRPSKNPKARSKPWSPTGYLVTSWPLAVLGSVIIGGWRSSGLEIIVQTGGHPSLDHLKDGDRIDLCLVLNNGINDHLKNFFLPTHSNQPRIFENFLKPFQNDKKVTLKD